MDRKIEISPGFVSMLCILGWLNLRLLGLVVLAAAIHEGGHLLALKILKVPVQLIQMKAAGLVIRTGLLSYGKEALCALAGPAGNLLFFTMFRRQLPEFAAIHLLLGLFNLLPIYPLDGGRAIRAAAALLFGEVPRLPTAWWGGAAAAAVFCTLKFGDRLRGWVLPAAAVMLLHILAAIRSEKQNGVAFL